MKKEKLWVINFFRENDFLPLLSIFLLTILMLKFTWLKWGSLLIDTGRELYIPQQILNGSHPYLDYFYPYGPVAPYLNAFICKLFGTQLSTFIGCGAFSLMIVCFCIYKIGTNFFSKGISLLMTLSYLIVAGFGQYDYAIGIFNFIIPYSYSATYGTMFALLCILCLYGNQPSKTRLIVSSILLYITILTKIEIGVALSASIIFSWLAQKNTLKEKLRTATIYFIIPTLFAIGNYILVYFIKPEVYFSFLNSLNPVKADNKILFSRLISGLFDLPNNLMSWGFSLAFYLIVVVVIKAASLISEKSIDRFGFKMLPIVIFIVLIFLLRILHWNLIYTLSQYNLLPLISLICLAHFIYHNYRANISANNKNVLGIAVALFSFFSCMRIFFKVSVALYGFYLIAAGFLCYYYFFFEIIPKIFDTNYEKKYYKYAFMVLMIFFTISHMQLDWKSYADRSTFIKTDKGDMKVLSYYKDYSELLTYLNKVLKPSDTLLVLPEGVILNYFTSKKNPIYYYHVLPHDLLYDKSEEIIIKEIDTKKVDYVIIVNRFTTDYGSARFGIDYAKKIFEYLKANYRNVKQYGEGYFPENEFGATVFQRITK